MSLEKVLPPCSMSSATRRKQERDVLLLLEEAL